MATTKFQHDCSACRFLGHYFDQDVYVCNRPGDLLGGSIIARYGNEGYEYTSMPLKLLQEQLLDPDKFIGDGENSFAIPGWIFSDRSVPSYKAWVMALAVEGLSKLITK